MKLGHLTTVILAISLLAHGIVFGDEDTTSVGWKKSLMFDVTTTQTAYSNSWVGGESGSFNWVTNLNAWAEKRVSPVVNFKSTLKLSFGQTSRQSSETRKWDKPEKSTDLIDWENVARLTVGGWADPYAAFRLETQFVDASFEPKKRMLTPLKLTESVGASKRLYEKEKNQVTTRVGLAMRQIIRNVVVDSVALTTEDSTLTDAGIESVTDVAITLHERINYTAKLTLFKALAFSKKEAVAGTEFEDDWKAIDVNWENIITAQITRIIAVNFYAQLLYDKEVHKKTRIKEVLGVSFVLKLM